MLTTFTQIAALAVVLHSQLVNDERVAAELAQKFSIEIWVVDQLPSRHSGGAMYVGDYDALCYRSLETPPVFRFLPAVIQSYCFTRITSISFRKPFPDVSVFDHLWNLKALKSIYLPGIKIPDEIKERFRLEFPDASLFNTNYSRLGELGATRINGEPSDAPKDGASHFDNGNRNAGDR
ncbi:MAG: hypothetical protein AAGG48_23370 [Planctomycetota bacterium]